jgi:Flp pilus assembly protein TadD
MADPQLQTKYHASDEDVQQGLAELRAGNFGLAQQRLQAGVERTPNDVTGWVGLAASYDRLRRFDLADRAYAQAIRLGGVNAAVLNNQGYSYLLRGDLVKARSSFLAAQALDPASPTIANNLKLLDGSRRHVKRSPGAY